LHLTDFECFEEGLRCEIPSWKSGSWNNID